MVRRPIAIVVGGFLALACSTADPSSTRAEGTQAQSADTTVAAPLPGWRLVWADEFDGPDGSDVDPDKWFHDTGLGNGGARPERQYYTDGTENARIEGGRLVMTARNNTNPDYICFDGRPCPYTSARIDSRLQHRYGRFEARIQVPAGDGLHPAFWMLGANGDRVGWPACGEIDIMEQAGRAPTSNSSHLLFPKPGAAAGVLTSTDVLTTGAFPDGYHTYAAEWGPGSVRFFIDGRLVGGHSRREAANWVFDHSFYMLLNVALGGPAGVGAPPADFDAATMNVDYVRVYDRTATEPSCPGLADGVYCGNDGIVAGEPNTLYACAATIARPVQACADWCRTNRVGDDVCVTGSSAPDCRGLSGSHCGGGRVGGEPNTIYKCVDGAVGSYVTCPHTCRVHQPARFDACEP